MNSTEDTTNVPQADRPGDIEHTIRVRMRAELAGLGLRRGSWRILRTLAEHPASMEQLAAERSSGGERGRRHGSRRGRSDHGHFGHGFDRRMAAVFAERSGPDVDRFDTDEERAAFIEEIRAHRPEVREARFQRGCTRHSDAWQGERRHGEHPHGEEHRSEHHHGERDQSEHTHGEHHHGERHLGERDHGEAHEHHDHHAGHDHRDRIRAHRIQAVLGDFAARGWVTFDDGVATLTDEGRKTYESAAERIRELLTSVAAEIK